MGNANTAQQQQQQIWMNFHFQLTPHNSLDNSPLEITYRSNWITWMNTLKWRHVVRNRSENRRTLIGLCVYFSSFSSWATHYYNIRVQSNLFKCSSIAFSIKRKRKSTCDGNAQKSNTKVINPRTVIIYDHWAYFDTKTCSIDRVIRIVRAETMQKTSESTHKNKSFKQQTPRAKQ